MTVLGRLIRCTRCPQQWDVIEIPRPFVDPDLYVCPTCRTPVGGEQLAIDDDPEPIVPIDELHYDPAIAEIPL